MPCRYVIDKERRLVISTGWDQVTFEEMKAHQDQLALDPEFNSEFNQLVDGTAVTTLDLSIDDIRTLTTRSLFSPTSRRAFVATQPAIYGMGRMLGAYAEMSKIPQTATVFYDLPSALQWLGLEETPDLFKSGEGKKKADPAVQSIKNGRARTA